MPEILQQIFETEFWRKKTPNKKLKTNRKQKPQKHCKPLTFSQVYCIT